jgi:hypothetical protein
LSKIDHLADIQNAALEIPGIDMEVQTGSERAFALLPLLNPLGKNLAVVHGA